MILDPVLPNAKCLSPCASGWKGLAGVMEKRKVLFVVLIDSKIEFIRLACFFVVSSTILNPKNFIVEAL